MHAGEYLNKQVVLERIRTERRRMEENLELLNSHHMEIRGIIGEWSVKDLLAHLVDWEQRFLFWYKAGLRGEVPQIPAPGISWGELDLLNQLIYEKHRDRSLEDVRTEFNTSFHQVLATIEDIPEEDMFAIGRYAWLGESNLAAYILANTADHYRWAKQQIRSWLKAQDRL